MKYIYFQWIRLLKNKIAAELRENKNTHANHKKGIIYVQKEDVKYIQ